MDTLQYITLEGERWDNVSFNVYGDAGLSARIIAANPNVPILDVIPMGTILDIPIIEIVEAATDPELLPPWKR